MPRFPRSEPDIAALALGSRFGGDLHRYAIVNESDLRDGFARVVAEREESAVKGQI
jgi:hypothetical protein